MRPIRINKELKDYFSKLIEEELNVPNSVLSIARSKIIAERNKYYPIDLEYDVFDEITSDFKSFLLFNPREQFALIQKWNGISPILFFNPDQEGKKKTTELGDHILKALNYNKFRITYAHKISEITGLKTCPYCNAMLTVVSRGRKGKKKARFQLDHFFPKSKHPLLSISFFNLIPSCGNCNLNKSSMDVDLSSDFHLYGDETPLECFRFEIPKESQARYLLTSKVDDIEIKLVKGKNGTINYLKHHNDIYDIEGLYSTQKDIVEELFWKAKAYPEDRIEELSILLKLPIPIIRRMVLGNYVDLEDIHKRPLAKFQQDIARQLGLIK